MPSIKKPKHTCPDIDGVIKTIASVIQQMENSEKSTSDDMAENLRSWVNELDPIVSGRWCELEELRRANSDLRTWGEQVEQEYEELQSEYSKLKDECDEKQSRIDDLENDVSDLEEQLTEFKELLNS